MGQSSPTSVSEKLTEILRDEMIRQPGVTLKYMGSREVGRGKNKAGLVLS